MSSLELSRKCISFIYLGRDILISKKQKIAESNSKSHPLKGRKLPSNNNFSVFKEESQNFKCKWEAKVNDHIFHKFIQIIRFMFASVRNKFQDCSHRTNLLLEKDPLPSELTISDSILIFKPIHESVIFPNSTNELPKLLPLSTSYFRGYLHWKPIPIDMLMLPKFSILQLLQGKE